MPALNKLQWDRTPGHYEVYYVSLTDGESGCGAWIRYTMVAPLQDTGDPATCSLWLMAMDPRDGTVIGRKESFDIDRLIARADPFELDIAGARLNDEGAKGAFDDVGWDLSWQSRLPGREHVHPFLQRAKIAKTVLVLPHPDLSISGRLSFAGRELELDGAQGGQAHLWGSKHASRWAWAHCNAFSTLDGEPRPGAFVDGVSVYVPRFGRELGPNTPIVARIDGRDLTSISPLRVLRNRSLFTLTNWSFEARDGGRRIVVEVDAPRDSLVGVTYHDPDGDLAYCYNTEIASMRVQVFERTGGRERWRLAETLVSDGAAHFEYAQREPVAGLELHVK